MSVTSTSVLFGRDQHRSRQFLTLAAAIFLVSIAFYGSVAIDAIPFIWQLAYVPVLIAVGGAMVNAYLNGGLLVSATNTVGIALALALTNGISAILFPASYYPGVAFYFALSVVFLVVGIGAFIVGAGTRRVVTFVG